MKNFTRSALTNSIVALAGLTLFASSASARLNTYPQTLCQPLLGSLSCIEYSQYGVHNVCTGTATVECPLPTSKPSSGSINVTQAAVFAYDRNTSTNVSCSVQRTDYQGSLLYSTTLSTSGSGSGVQAKYATFTQSHDGYWRMRCSIPAVQSGNLSHVANAYLQTSE